MNKVAIVILNWNGRSFLEKYLPILKMHCTPEKHQIIIADNGSTDSSVEYLSKSHPEIQCIQLDKNYGFAGGYNKALKQIKATYYLLLNSDIEVTPDWIDPMVELLDCDPTFVVCMPKIKQIYHRDSFEYAGAAGGFIDILGYPFCRGRILDIVEKDWGQYNTSRQIFWATGACMLIKSDKFWEVNGFDEDFFAHMEEIDLCWRLKNRGYKIIYTPNSTVYHVGGGTLPNNSPFKLFLNYRNSLYMLLKNLPSRFLLIIIFTRMILDGVSALIYLLGFRFKMAMAVWKAHIQVYRNLSYVLNKRKNNPIPRRLHSTIYKNSIVFKKLVLGKKNFSSLNF